MGGAQARRLCPQAVVVPPRMSAYSEASKAVFEVFEDTAPLVEGLSIDEAFLDVRGLRRISGAPLEIAVRLRREVLERVGLPITVGVASTKFLAKVASGVAKPDGLLVVPPDGELDFLHPLPVERLWGVGRVTAEKLHDAGPQDGRPGGALAEATLVSTARARVGPAPPRARPQPRPAARCRRAAAGARWARSARSGRSPRSHEALDATLVGARRPARPPAAGRTAGLPHRRAAAALRRLLASHPLAHARRGDRADPDDPRHREGAAGRGHAADRAAGASRWWGSRSATSRTTTRSSSRCPSRATARGRSTSPSTPCAIGSDRTPSPAPCCSDAIRV